MATRAIAAETRQDRNYFARHWAGEHSLPRAYWLNSTVIVGGGTIAAAAVAATLGDQIGSLKASAVVGILFWPVAIAAWVWGVVGIWRSADRHTERGGAVGWANVAKVMVFFGWVSMTGQILGNAVPQVTELGKIALGRDPLGRAATVQVASNGQSVEVRGALTDGTSARLTAVLRAAPHVKTLLLDSKGGRLFEAEHMARLVKERRMNTYVEKECFSACTMIFVSGVNRSSTPKARIGFHQPTFPGTDAATQQSLIADHRQFLLSAGIESSFVDQAMETPPDSMWFPTYDEMRSANVITRVSFGGETSHGFSSVHTKSQLRETMLLVPMMRAFAASYPAEFDQMLEEGWTTKGRGGTDSEVQLAMRSVLAANYPKIFAGADDATAAEFADLVAAQMREVQPLGPDVCQRYMAGTLVATAVMKSETINREISLVERALLSQEALPIDVARAEADIEMISRNLNSAEISAVLAPGSRGPAVQCQATKRLYEEIGALPQSRRANLTRYLLSE